ncbi:transmembrane protein, putative (macronuclear) [Tetrahymena thermophila SB210]|uniref:Transmembrane protein, putative n=1 Tax=Tetrahymena thermophila (strain SB210) TaxID=312017 RepID=I7LV64_TETTS|nr:transmembrane protein, putative [Tetrahymena thermophila SB210]EAR97297.3 transmembrane protein, putative [Tetrahymena thermophila SB210]|eukprot:XP_001017542.3 transmembrane protein, putative [Tetrahymena thermophila SB210]
MKKQNIILVAIVVFACASFIQTKNVGQLEIIKKYCSEQLKNCTNNKACSQAISKCQNQNDITIVDCLQQCNSFYAQEITKCHNEKAKNLNQLDIIQRFCSVQLNTCIQDRVCYRLLNDCESKDDISVIECLQQSNSLYANQITQCHDENSDN